MDPKRIQARNELQRSVVQHQQEFQQAMGELTSNLQGQFQRARQRIVQTRQQLDLSTRIKERPWPWLMGSFGVGLLLGARRRFSEMLREAGF